MEPKVRTKNVSCTLVIGNGFDLACGLPSSFGDYANYLHDENRSGASKALIEFYNCCLEGLTEKPNSERLFELAQKCEDENVWELVFLALAAAENESLFGLRWLDIEQALHDILLCVSSSKYQHFSPFCLKPLLFEYRSADDSRLHNLGMPLLFSLKNKKVLEYEGEDGAKNAYAYLLRELDVFEKHFAEYLEKKINAAYLKRARFLMDVLYSSFPNPIDIRRNLLSFNYVNYSSFSQRFPDAKDICTKNDWTCNVHGCLGKGRKVLLGITPSNEELSDSGRNKKSLCGPMAAYPSLSKEAYMFSKEFRRLDLFEADFGFIQLPDIDGDVIFFGCSLSRQDYHTIFRIFDSVLGNKNKVLNEETDGRLFFGYFVYDESKRSEITRGHYLAIKEALLAWQSERGQEWRNILDDLLDHNRIWIHEIRRQKSWPRKLLEQKKNKPSTHKGK